MIRKIFISPIKIYQALISPYLGHHCRFWPSCSEYFCQAVKKYGIPGGILLGLKRLFKCHPLNKGGVDIP